MITWRFTKRIIPMMLPDVQMVADALQQVMEAHCKEQMILRISLYSKLPENGRNILHSLFAEYFASSQLTLDEWWSTKAICLRCYPRVPNGRWQTTAAVELRWDKRWQLECEVKGPNGQLCRDVAAALRQRFPQYKIAA